MVDEYHLMGLFRHEDQAAAVIRELNERPWKLKRVHSPIPSRLITEALKLKKSRVGLFTLFGGIFGLLSGFALSIFTATRWDLIIGGKPFVALIPFAIVGFEFTILSSVIGNVIGFLVSARLPMISTLELYDPRCSSDRFGILVGCEEGQKKDLEAFFKQHKGEIRVFDAQT
jgi:molybdopterin-containing oxidoreductase family membrane subunit